MSLQSSQSSTVLYSTLLLKKGQDFLDTESHRRANNTYYIGITYCTYPNLCTLINLAVCAALWTFSSCFVLQHPFLQTSCRICGKLPINLSSRTDLWTFSSCFYLQYLAELVENCRSIFHAVLTYGHLVLVFTCNILQNLLKIADQSVKQH